MKTIFLLGGFGFIGTNILKYIDLYKPNDYSVIVFDKLPTHPYQITFNCIEKVYTGEFSDSLFLESIFQQHKFDIVIHSISTTVPATSYNPRFDIQSNLIPTVELLNLMVKYNIFDIAFISSGGAIYGNSVNGNKHKETDRLFPLSSYGIVKLAIENYLFQYAKLYNLRPLVLRLSNPYGKYHYSKMQGVLNIALSTALKSEKFKVWGNGSAIKDFIYIDDFCKILFLLLPETKSFKILNVGSGQAISINDALNQIKLLKSDFQWNYADALKYDVSHFEIDNTELIKLIGNYNFKSLTEGLSLTWKWLKE